MKVEVLLLDLALDYIQRVVLKMYNRKKPINLNFAQ